MSEVDAQNLLTRPQLAAAMGVSVSTVTRWERDQCPVAKKRKRGQSTLFDLVAVQAWVQEMEATKAETAVVSLELERALLARAQREAKEMDNAVRRGELWPMDVVILDGQHFAKGLQAKVRSIPRRLTHAGIIGRDQESAVMKLLNDLLTDISNWRTVADSKKVVRSRGAA